MAKYIHVKVAIELLEARPSDWNYVDTLKIGTYSVYSKFDIVYDPNETPADYYNGWEYDPNTGYDYTRNSIAGVSYEKQQQEYFLVHNREIPLWYTVAVDDDFVLPSDIPIIGGSPDGEPGEDPTVDENGDVKFNWPKAIWDAGKEVVSDALEEAGKNAVIKILTPQLGQQLVNSLMNTEEARGLLVNFGNESADVLKKGILGFGNMSATEYKQMSDRLFVETYANFANGLGSVMERNGLLKSNYLDPVYKALNISINNTEYGASDVKFGAGEPQSSNGNDFIVTPGSAIGIDTADGDDVVLMGTGGSSVSDSGGSDTYVAQGNGNEAYFSANSSDVYVTAYEGGASITHFQTGDHDNILGFSRAHFYDQSVAFDRDGNAGQAYRLYQAAFDRKPDASGLGHWIQELDDAATDLISMANSFIVSDEFRITYGTPDTVSNSAFLSLVYQNVLDRSPDDGGFSYWIAELDGGLEREKMLASFSESNENRANVALDIENGIWYV